MLKPAAQTFVAEMALRPNVWSGNLTTLLAEKNQLKFTQWAPEFWTVRRHCDLRTLRSSLQYLTIYRSRISVAAMTQKFINYSFPPALCLHAYGNDTDPPTHVAFANPKRRLPKRRKPEKFSGYSSENSGQLLVHDKIV